MHTHIWIDMLQFTGPVQDREGETIDFLPIWLCVDPRATFIFITQTEAERRGVSYLFFLFPRQQGPSESEEVRLPVRGECGFTEINITWNTLDPSLCLSACVSLNLSIIWSVSLKVFRLHLPHPSSWVVLVKVPRLIRPAAVGTISWTLLGSLFKQITGFSHVAPVYAALRPDRILQPSFFLIN